MILFNSNNSFSTFFLISLFLVIVYFVLKGLKQLFEFISNNRKEIVTLDATITQKQSRGPLVQNYKTGQQEFSEHYLEFDCQDQQHRCFKVKKDVLFNHEVGDTGKLKYQGTRFHEFNCLEEDE